MFTNQNKTVQFTENEKGQLMAQTADPKTGKTSGLQIQVGYRGPDGPAFSEKNFENYEFPKNVR